MPRQFNREALRGPQEPVSGPPSPEPEETPMKVVSYDQEAKERSWVLEEEHTPEEFARLTFEQRQSTLTARLYFRIRKMREAANRDDVLGANKAMFKVIETYDEIEAMGPHDVFH